MISIIIPLFNKKASIERSVRSVLGQSFEDFEVIIVDDGSTDKSIEVVRSIEDFRIKMIQQKNGGPSSARNTGVKYAKGEWIIFLDADDELLPDALQEYATLAYQHADADIIDCGQIISTPSGTRNMPHTLEGYSNKPLRDWYFCRIAPGSNHSIFRKTIVEQYSYDERIRRFEDAELLTRMLQTAKVYSSTKTLALVHAEYAAASVARRYIMEDFLGYIDLSKGGFWYKMNVFKIFIEEREHYSEECHKRYPHLYKRYDFLVIYKIFHLFKKIFV